MDMSSDIFSNVIANLIATGITWLGTKVFKGTASVIGFEDADPSLEDFLSDVIDEASATIEWQGSSSIEEVCLFLNEPEAHMIVRQIYSTLFQNSGGIEKIEQEFVTQLANHLVVSRQEITLEASSLFHNILQRCQSTLQTATEHGWLAGHEALSVQRHQMLIDEIESIRIVLDHLAHQDEHPPIREILKLEQLYRTQAHLRHGTLTPPIVNRARTNVPLDTIYVVPDFVSDELSNNQEGTLDFDEMKNVFYRTVILGNPGGGKSTLVQKLTYDFASQSENLTPFIVVLREYGIERKDKNHSIIEYLEMKIKTDYQIHLPKKAIEYLLLSGRAFVIFDGLDELLDTAYRQDIAKDVELFCNLYPATPVIVTSRQIGYDEAPLSTLRFEVIRLASFTPDQVVEYVNKWFDSDEELVPSQRDQKKSNFLNDLEPVPEDLKSSPLLLALICNMYFNDGYLPQNLPQVYKRCAELLFEKWDKSRNIRPSVAGKSYVRPAMNFLAYWIYETPELQSGVTEPRLVSRAKEYLLKKIDDEDAALIEAKEFIDFCTGRAWVFTDMGTTGQGELLFQFTHRTFLEYFTAEYLVRIHSTPFELLTTLLPHIKDQEWDTVAQLAFQQFSLEKEDASDHLIDGLINAGEEETNQERAINILAFASRCMSFIVPSTATTRRLTLECLKLVLNWCREVDVSERSKTQHIEPKAYQPLSTLMNSHQESYTTVSQTLLDSLLQHVQGDDTKLQLIAIEFGEIIEWFPLIDGRSISPNKWHNIQEEFHNNLLKYPISTFAPTSKTLALRLFWDTKIDLSDLVSWYGYDILVFDTRSSALPRVSMSSAGKAMLRIFKHSYPYPISDEAILHRQKNLELLGEILFKEPTPWFRVKGKRASSNFAIPGEDKYDTPSNTTDSSEFLQHDYTELSLSRDCLFGVFILLATYIELDADKKISVIQSSQDSFYRLIRWIFLARVHENVSRSRLHKELNLFSSPHRRFIRRWIAHEINLVAIDTESSY